MPLPIRRHALLVSGRVMLAIAGVALLGAVLVTMRLFAGQEELPVAAGQPNAGQAADGAAVAPATPSNGRTVGIVAGHAGYDSGALCPDGWAEAGVNMTVASEVQDLLVRHGYHVDLLHEFDERLDGYKADALVSIHADSCDVPGASGFKVARVTDSAIPEAEDRLVACIYQEYEATTGLPRHPSSITDNMTDYHAFREIDHFTPGAIIEVGFLLDDRDLLVNRPKVVARGIASGVVCFLEDSQP